MEIDENRLKSGDVTVITGIVYMCTLILIASLMTVAFGISTGLLLVVASDEMTTTEWHLVVVPVGLLILLYILCFLIARLYVRRMLMMQQ